MNKLSVILISVLGAVLASCASTSMPDPEPAVEHDGAGTSLGAYEGDGIGSGETFTDDAPPGLRMIIYFDFDQSELTPESMDLVARHADQLTDGTLDPVRLEGHADERGSREYNVGLGERRSQAVRRVLLAHGVTMNQVSTVSFGEERPAAAGADEQSHALNRRVEIRYLN